MLVVVLPLSLKCSCMSAFTLSSPTLCINRWDSSPPSFFTQFSLTSQVLLVSSNSSSFRCLCQSRKNILHLLNLQHFHCESGILSTWKQKSLSCRWGPGRKMYVKHTEKLKCVTYLCPAGFCQDIFLGFCVHVNCRL